MTYTEGEKGPVTLPDSKSSSTGGVREGHKIVTILISDTCLS